MNYIILNDISSQTIQGLVIQELPPITLSPMRVQIETIDGKDGDISTYLGRDAYDKTIRIGLSRVHDIDAVIGFFANNMNGEVIFSNEPDKYYRYEITEQIDFEKLVRFRQALVILHVQPYKYKVGEMQIVSTSGFNNITIDNEGNAPAFPIVTIYGQGDIDVYLENIQILSMSMGDYEYITIDTEKQNAYCGGVFVNRNVTGDYSKLLLPSGTSHLRLDGTVTEVQISNYVRWY